MPNFIFLACLELAEKFMDGVGWGLCGFQISTGSNLNLSCIQLELGLGFDDKGLALETFFLKPVA